MRLYDGTETQLPRDEVYFLDKNKFELDTQYIVLCEDQWVGKAVVYRNTDTGTYQLGKWICNDIVYFRIPTAPGKARKFWENNDSFFNDGNIMKFLDLKKDRWKILEDTKRNAF